MIRPGEMEYAEPPWLTEIYRPEEASAFRKLTKAISKTKDTIVLDGGFSTPHLVSILYDLVHSDPLLYAFRSIRSIDPSNRSTVVNIGYDDVESSTEYRKQIDDRVEHLYHEMGIGKCKTDLDIAYAVNNWLVDNCRWSDDEDFFDGRSAIGVLMHGRGTCSSFALTYTLLLRCFGVECHTVIGRLNDYGEKSQCTAFCPTEFKKNILPSFDMNKIMRVDMSPDYCPEFNSCGFREYLNGEDGHVWNAIILKNGSFAEPRHVDVTLNRGYSEDAPVDGRHNYFGLISKEIGKNRSIFFGPGFYRYREID